MALGILANVTVTLLASLAYLAAARSAQGKQRSQGRRTGPAPLFFALVSIYLALAAGRQIAAELGSPAWDLRIYLLNIPFAALAIIPHAYLVVQVQTGSDRRAGQVALALLLLIAWGVAAALLGDVTPQPRTDYGTDWQLQSLTARILIVVVILLPGLVGSGWLVHLSRRLVGPERRRIRLIGWASLGYFVLFTLDAYGMSGPAFLAARVLTAGTGLLAWFAVHSPGTPRKARDPFKFYER